MGRLLKDLDDLVENGRVGDWCFVQSEERLLMFLRYPVQEWAGDLSMEEQRGDIVNLPLSGPKHPVWQWDGNRESPTLSPSINVIGRWHGWLRAGKLETA